MLEYGLEVAMGDRGIGSLRQGRFMQFTSFRIVFNSIYSQSSIQFHQAGEKFLHIYFTSLILCT
jgi:hypothetical protein